MTSPSGIEEPLVKLAITSGFDSPSHGPEHKLNPISPPATTIKCCIVFFITIGPNQPSKSSGTLGRIVIPAYKELQSVSWISQTYPVSNDARRVIIIMVTLSICHTI